MNKYYKDNFHMIKYVHVLIILVILLLTIGYSAFSSNLAINDVTAVFRKQRIIQVTGMSLVDTAEGGVSNYNSYENTTVSASITLPNSNSTVTYNVAITSIGNDEVGIVNISGLPSNLTFTGYCLGTMLCDDTDSTVCSLGAVSTIELTFGYAANGYDSSNTSYDFNLSLVFDAVPYVARIGSTNYGTLQSAINAVGTTGSTLRL